MERRFAWFSLTSPRLGFTAAPEGGFCLSSFLVALRQGSILLGRFSSDPSWEHLAGLDEERVEREVKSAHWILPSSHLLIGESPDQCAKRVAEEILLLKSYDVRYTTTLNYYEDSSRYPGRLHWDLCFVYGLRSDEELKKVNHFSEMRYVSLSEVKHEEIGRGQADILETLGLL